MRATAMRGKKPSTEWRTGALGDDAGAKQGQAVDQAGMPVLQRDAELAAPQEMAARKRGHFAVLGGRLGAGNSANVVQEYQSEVWQVAAALAVEAAAAAIEEIYFVPGGGELGAGAGIPARLMALDAVNEDDPAYHRELGRRGSGDSASDSRRRR